MDKGLLLLLTWLFLLGGLFGMIVGIVKFFGEGTPAEYGVMGIGGGLYLLSCAITIFIKHRVESH